jgi:hypothetical protein
MSMIMQYQHRLKRLRPSNTTRVTQWPIEQWLRPDSHRSQVKPHTIVSDTTVLS